MRNNLLVRREKIVQRINDDGLLQDNNENTLRTACVLRLSYIKVEEKIAEREIERK